MPFIIPAILGATAIGGYLFYKKKFPPLDLAPIHTRSDITATLAHAMTSGSTDNFVPVDFNGETWLVAPDYVGPVGIGEAANIAKAAGMELPSPGLVDAIWRQADLKLLPMPRQNIVSAAVFADQQRKIKEQIGDRPFTLLGGAFKDVVAFQGHPQLYGWHVEDERAAEWSKIPSNAGIALHKPFTAGLGKIIQGPSGGAHDSGFKDYSQGLRLVKKKEANA